MYTILVKNDNSLQPILYGAVFRILRTDARLRNRLPHPSVRAQPRPLRRRNSSKTPSLRKRARATAA